MTDAYSINERAERLMGRRVPEGKSVVPFDLPPELGYHCPVCEYEQMVDEHYDERLDWSEYKGFLWCAVCNVDYPSALCQPDVGKAIETFLDTVEDAVRVNRVRSGCSGCESSGAELIAAERQRQVEAEGWTDDHDDEHAEGDLYEAAIAYLLALHEPEGMAPPDVWPWGVEWWKPTPGDPVRQLVKAGALIAAEIDRLSRVAP